MRLHARATAPLLTFALLAAGSPVPLPAGNLQFGTPDPDTPWRRATVVAAGMAILRLRPEPGRLAAPGALTQAPRSQGAPAPARDPAQMVRGLMDAWHDPEPPMAVLTVAGLLKGQADFFGELDGPGGRRWIQGRLAGYREQFAQRTAASARRWKAKQRRRHTASDPAGPTPVDPTSLELDCHATRKVHQLYAAAHQFLAGLPENPDRKRLARQGRMFLHAIAPMLASIRQQLIHAQVGEKICAFGQAAGRTELEALRALPPAPDREARLKEREQDVADLAREQRRCGWRSRLLLAAMDHIAAFSRLADPDPGSAGPSAAPEHRPGPGRFPDEDPREPAWS